MFDDILAAIPFGIILAFTIGPVFFVLLETSATKGFKSALIFDCGVMLADILFIFVAFYSTNRLLEKVKDFADKYGIGSDDIKNLSIAALLSKMMNGADNDDYNFMSNLMNLAKGMGLSEAVKLMRGKPGDAIELVITREGEPKPLKIKIVRAIIKVKSVKKRILEKDYAYLRISSFQSQTTTSTRDAIKELMKENKANIKGLVLDLRDNPGGVLNGAVGVSDVFLRKGRIVYTEGRVDDAVLNYDAAPDDLLEDAPLVVLVNQGSASASEIVAGALQDHKRALILGTKTFGKGSVQTVLPLDEKTGLKLTTARYFTPSGRSIQAKGIEPDIIVEALEFKSKESDTNTVSPLSESDLTGHLSNPNNKKKDEITNENSADDKLVSTEKKSLAQEDYQLYEALNILKSMNLVRLMNLKKG